jgi:MFS family permease
LTVTLVSSISSSFSAAELLPWLGLSYMLSTCVFSPIYGKLSDVVGRKPAILTACVSHGLVTFCSG